jgi:bisphosphoglycerate-dependent phosphoglycerate mutase
VRGMSKYRVVFVRHGESEWTFQNLFCGWVDIGLTDKGKWSYRSDITNLTKLSEVIVVIIQI